MMRVSFDTDAIEKWANFSGDYNPIHFDPAAARKVSDNGLVAHGMLVLLPVKQLITELHGTTEPNRWIRLQSSFRQAVPQLHDVDILIRQVEQKTRYKVVRAACGQVHFEGSMASSDPPARLIPDMGITLDRKTVRLRWEYFTGSFPDIKASWIFLDALLFSEFVVRSAPTLLRQITDENASKCSFQTTNYVVVQTSQTVCFDISLLEPAAFPNDLDLAYRYTLADILTDEDRVIGKVKLEGWLGDRPVLQSEVGLVLDKSGVATKAGNLETAEL